MANRIMDTTVIFVIKSIHTNEIKGETVYLSKEKAERRVSEYEFNGESVYVDSIESGNSSVLVTNKYPKMTIVSGSGPFPEGDYFEYGMQEMYDVCYKSDIYPSTETAKMHMRWLQIVENAKTSPERFNIYRDKICSKDWNGDDWVSGDVMEGNMSAEIMKLKVIR